MGRITSCMPRRKFLKTVWGGIVVFGSGMVGIPFGARAADGSRPTPELLRGLDLESLPEMSPGEVRVFAEQADQAAREHIGSTASADGEGQRPRLPPGQHTLQAMPVFGHNPSPRSLTDWTLTVRGEVEQELSLTWQEFLQLPRVKRTVDVHCVTHWSVLDVPWKGVLLSTLLGLAGPKKAARFLVFDCEQGYTTNIPLSEAAKDNVMVADGLFGEALPHEHGGPARGLVPDLYFYKSGKWLTGLRVLAKDEPGFWETRGYSNTADPWRDDRYSESRLD